jgi:hypothetical protein
MAHAPHQTTPFRRPTTSWIQDSRPDPAEVGTAFGLELCLEGEKSNVGHGQAEGQDEPAEPPLCP